MIPPVQHGVDGWDLILMHWSEETGVASLVYERVVDGKTERSERCVEQPHATGHDGWERFLRN